MFVAEDILFDMSTLILLDAGNENNGHRVLKSSGRIMFVSQTMILPTREMANKKDNGDAKLKV
jgi:hypothetical protein